MAENPILNDRYRLIEQIGAGGMAVIYRAQDMVLGRIVAIKVLRPSLVGDPEFLVRFKREAQSAARLSHPNIVTVHDVGQDGPNTHYIVMEHVEGQNLKQLIRARGAFDVDAALAIIIEVCKGVGYAHRAGLVHCDIKPQNILVTPDNMIKVADFGIARAFTATQTEHEEVVWGSPHYFSPEQAAGEPPTPASDVYSIGIVLFELLTARLPFTGADYNELARAHLTQTPPSIRDIDPSLPQELDRIIRKVLSKEPSARYRTADQLGRILKTYRDRGIQPTSSFVVTPSDQMHPLSSPASPSSALQDTTPSGMPTRRQAEQQQDTLPGLPPIDVESAYERSRAQRVPSTPPAYTPPPPPPPYTPPDYYGPPLVVEEEEEAPGLDIENILLGILAAAAVIGLIPLWLTVYFTFTR
ncbi:MAG: hypothetical protein Kow00124_03470 [Anaerolineae bacterium]